MSQETAPGWVVPAMRIGYATRGITYVLIGGLAVLAAWTGGNAEGTKGAMQELREQPWGTWILGFIALGLACYAIWRFICAWMDLEDRGHDAKGTIARIGQTVTGLIHAGLAFSVGRMAFGSGGSSGEGGGTQTLASKVLAMENGAMIVMIAGIITIGAGIYYGYKGVAEKYKEHIRSTPTAEKLDPAIKAGLIAHGVVIVLIGVFLYYAGQNTDPGQAGGIGKAFDAVRGMAFGRILLALLGLGTIGFAVYCFVEAAYRIVPRAQDSDVTTLASRAKAKAEGSARRAAAQVG